MDAFDFYGWESNERYDDTRDDTDNDTWATDDGWSDSSSSSSDDEHNDLVALGEVIMDNDTPETPRDVYTPGRLASAIHDLNVMTPGTPAASTTHNKGNKRRLQFETLDITIKDLTNARKVVGYRAKSREFLDHIIKSHGSTGKIHYTDDDILQITKAGIKLVKSRRSKEIVDDNDIILTLTSTDDTATPVKKRKPPVPKTKNFSDLKPDSQRKRVRVFGEKVRDFIKNMLEEAGLGKGTAVEELDVIGAALKAANPDYERYSNDIRSRVLPPNNKISDMHGLIHKTECRSSQEQSDKLRRFLKKECGVEYPSKYALRALTAKRVPTITHERHIVVAGKLVARGSFISYPDALRHAVIQLFELGHINQTTTVIELEIKDGLDGAGNQMEITQQWKKMVTMGFVVLKATDKTDNKNVTIYENSCPNSNFSFKPLCMILEDESYELVKYLFERYLKKQPNMVVAITKDFQVNVSFKIVRCMLDGKVRGIASGRSAAHCFTCPWTLDNYCDKKTKNQAVTVHYLKYDQGDENETTENLFFRVLRAGWLGSADAKKRLNCVEEPLTNAKLGTLDSMTILHSVINCCRLFFNSLVISVCCDLKTVKPNKNMTTHNVKARDDGIKKYAKKLRKKMKIVVRDIGHGNTGGGLVGNHAKKFFENGKDICEKIFPSTYTKSFVEVIQNMHVILLILNSNLPVVVKDYGELCRDTIGKIQKNLPFFRFSPTLHTVLFHSWEHIQNHDCRGLGKYGEDAVEMAMGRCRNARKFQSFRGNLQRNMEDAMKVTTKESDYFMNSDMKKVKRSQRIYHKLTETAIPEVIKLIDISRCTAEERKGLFLRADQ